MGFTGTPIDATLDVFDPVVDAYTMTESVRDEITVRIVYEGRAAKVILNNSKLKEIEDYYAKCAEVNRKFEGKNKGLVVDYMGIKTQMNLALKQYSEGDKDNFEDIAESIIIVRNHLDLLAKLFHTFDNSKYFKGTTIQQLNTLNFAAEFAQQSKEFETRFMGLVKRLKAAYDICAGSEQLTQLERDYTHFYLAVRSPLFFN